MGKIITALSLFAKNTILQFRKIVLLSFIKNGALSRKTELYRRLLFIVSVALMLFLVTYFALHRGKNLAEDSLLTGQYTDIQEYNAVSTDNNKDDALGLNNNKPVDIKKLPDLDKFTIAGDYPSQTAGDDSQTKKADMNNVPADKLYGASDTLKSDKSKPSTEQNTIKEKSGQETQKNDRSSLPKDQITVRNKDETKSKEQSDTSNDSSENKSNEKTTKQIEETEQTDKKNEIQTTDSKQTDKKTDEAITDNKKTDNKTDNKTDAEATLYTQSEKKTEKQVTDNKQTDNKISSPIVDKPEIASSEKVKEESDSNKDSSNKIKKEEPATEEKEKNKNQKSGEIQGSNSNAVEKKDETIKESSKSFIPFTEDVLTVEQKTKNPQQVIKKQIKNQFQYAQNKFSISLLYSMFQRSEFNSTILSPLSIGMQLGLLLNAVGSNTIREITSILQMKSFSKEQINLMYKTLLQSIIMESQQKSPVKLFFTNYACLNTALPFGSSAFRKNFVDVGKASYFTEFVSYNLQTDEGYKNYAAWLKKITQNTAKSSDPRIKSVSIVLHNYFYISGKWLYSFKQENKEDYFYNKNGNAVKIKYMQFEKPIMTNIYRHSHFDMILLPYSNEKVVFVMIVPNENQTFSDVIQYLYTTTFDILFKRTAARPLLLSLPKIRIDRKWDVMPTLNAMGLSHIPGLLLNGSTLINGLDHTVSFGFKETGLVKAPQIDGKSQETLVMEVNKPFVFFIYDQESGMILFEGLVQNLE